MSIFQTMKSLAVLALLLLTACASGPAERNQTPLTPLRQAQTELPAADVLNVNVVTFTADIPTGDDPEIELIYSDIRAAEARFMPFELRQALAASGQWGDVRVIPESIPSSQLELRGHIIESHGEELKLHITAVDAANRVWLDKQYQGYADLSTYQRRNPATSDPFQDVYHRIANDLVTVRSRLPAADKQDIAQLASIKFAFDLAPQAYARYLREKNGQLFLADTPPAGDPLLARIELAAERDARMVDVLDQYYLDFHQRMQPPYQSWRASSYQEMQNLRELQQQARTRKAVGIAAIIGGIIGVVESNDRESNEKRRNTGGTNAGTIISMGAIVGGIYALSSGIDKGRQTNIHVASLREMARSLSNDMQPRNLDLKDRTVRLTGSAEHQYREWRVILADMIAVDDRQDIVVEPDNEQVEPETNQ